MSAQMACRRGRSRVSCRMTFVSTRSHRHSCGTHFCSCRRFSPSSSPHANPSSPRHLLPPSLSTQPCIHPTNAVRRRRSTPSSHTTLRTSPRSRQVQMWRPRMPCLPPSPAQRDCPRPCNLLASLQHLSRLYTVRGKDPRPRERVLSPQSRLSAGVEIKAFFTKLVVGSF